MRTCTRILRTEVHKHTLGTYSVVGTRVLFTKDRLQHFPPDRTYSDSRERCSSSNRQTVFFAHFNVPLSGVVGVNPKLN